MHQAKRKVQATSSTASGTQILVGSVQERARWMRDHKLMEKLRHEHIDIGLLLGDESNLPQATWREQVLEVLHSRVGQIVLALLIVLDSLLIVSEIIVDVKYLSAEAACLKTEIAWLEGYIMNTDEQVRHIWHAAKRAGSSDNLMEYLQYSLRGNNTIERRLSSSTRRRRGAAVSVASAFDEANNAFTLSSGNGNGNGNGNGTVYVYDYEYDLHDLEATLLRRESDMHRLEALKNLVHISSVIILSVFIVEVTLKMVCMRIKFFTSKLELLDGAIIWASFLVDIITFIGHTEAPEASVMIILLIWRIVRLVNGFLIQEKQRSEAQTEILKQVHQLTMQEVMYLRDQQVARTQFVNCLRAACRERGMLDTEIDDLQPKTLTKVAENGLQVQAAVAKRSKKLSFNLEVLSHLSLSGLSTPRSKRTPSTPTPIAQMLPEAEETGDCKSLEKCDVPCEDLQLQQSVSLVSSYPCQ